MRLRRWSISACRSSHCGLRRRNSICCVDSLQVSTRPTFRLRKHHYRHNLLLLNCSSSSDLRYPADRNAAVIIYTSGSHMQFYLILLYLTT
ncbi:hypothetical protein X975_03138, partial [Stegodyphus mimosarum]